MVEDKVKIAVLSGKGGAGKTLLSVNLAVLVKQAVYIDCDVEEPNGHLFLKPNWETKKEIGIKIPVINYDRCTGCRRCVDFCKYNALSFIYKKVYVLDNLCHSCGGCALLCPSQAIDEKTKIIGEIKRGHSQGITVISGILNPGIESGVPIIKEILVNNIENKLTFIDCPPGSACTVMESIKDVDYCVLVTEPTILGVHNLNMIVNLVALKQKLFGVVINKYFDEDNPAENYCQNQNIKIIGKIPYDHHLSQMTSNALIPVLENEKYASLFQQILQDILKEVQGETIINS